jgi:threonyl-tRNA synthetase
MLQRIYGTAWENEEQLKAYIHFKEEAKRRDHRRLGQDLDLFSIQVQLKLLQVDCAFYFDRIYESNKLAFFL